MKMLSLAILVGMSCVSFPVMAFDWPNNAVSAISISADDGWSSQLAEADILKSYGFRGTFYLTSAVTSNADFAAWAVRSIDGHEIGNHTYTHRHPFPQNNELAYSWQQEASEVGNMEWILLSRVFDFSPKDHTFAYPFGDKLNYTIYGRPVTSNPPYTAQETQVGMCEFAGLLSAVVSGARIGDGIAQNDPLKVAQRRYYIHGLPIFGVDSENPNTPVDPVQSAKNAIDEGIARGTWTVLIFHGLDNDGPYSTSRSDYIKILQYIKSKQSSASTTVWVAPIVDVMRYCISTTPAEPWNCVDVE